MRKSPLDPQKIRYILKEAGMKYSAFARHVGIPQKEFSQILNGWLVPNADYTSKIRNGMSELIPFFEALQRKSKSHQ